MDHEEKPELGYRQADNAKLALQSDVGLVDQLMQRVADRLANRLANRLAANRMHDTKKKAIQLTLFKFDS